MSEPAIRVEHLSRWYGEVIGLNDISVDIGPGITGLLGPNGAGKSSLLRVLSGELRPSSGRVTVMGESPFANPRLHRMLGYCPEGDRFFDRLRARDFLVYLLRLSGYTKADAHARADRALIEVGMLESAQTRLGACSKGMRQRIKLAQAIAHDPPLLLLDEPLSGLDPLARHATQDLIKRRAKEGAMVVVSSHVLHEVEALTTSIITIHEGRIVAAGEMEDIRSEMDRHPHRIRLTSEEPRRLAGLLIDRPDLLALAIEDDVLQISTDDPDGFYRDLASLLVEHQLAVTSLTSPDDRLEAVFQYLVERR